MQNETLELSRLNHQAFFFNVEICPLTCTSVRKEAPLLEAQVIKTLLDQQEFS